MCAFHGRDEGMTELRQALAAARATAAAKEAERASAAQAAAQQGPLVDALEAELAGLRLQVWDLSRCGI